MRGSAALPLLRRGGNVRPIGTVSLPWRARRRPLRGPAGGSAACRRPSAPRSRSPSALCRTAASVRSRGRSAARAAVDDQVSERRETAEALLDGGLADGVEDKSTPRPSVSRSASSAKSTRRVVDHVVRSKAAHEVDLSLARHRADHSCSGRLGDLNGGDADPPAAEWTSTHCPAAVRWQLCNRCHAVSTAIGNAAPCSNLMSSGSGITRERRMRAYSANAPMPM